MRTRTLLFSVCFLTVISAICGAIIIGMTERNNKGSAVIGNERINESQGSVASTTKANSTENTTNSVEQLKPSETISDKDGAKKETIEEGANDLPFVSSGDVANYTTASDESSTPSSINEEETKPNQSEESTIQPGDDEESTAQSNESNKEETSGDDLPFIGA